MLVRSPTALAMAGMVSAILFAPPLYAQSNPFIPASPASKADVERMLDERMAGIRDEIAKLKSDAPASAPGTPGGPGAMPNGGAVGGAMGPPDPLMGSPLGAGPQAALPIEEPKGAVEAARGNGVRFLGCINGQQKFVRNSGERVAFTAKEIREAVKAGFVPECR